jgi:hypothetical protein
LQHTASVERQFTRSGVPPLRLAGNEGLVVRNLIGMGAAGTAKVTLELDVSLTPAT